MAYCPFDLVLYSSFDLTTSNATRQNDSKYVSCYHKFRSTHYSSILIYQKRDKYIDKSSQYSSVYTYPTLYPVR